jgi:acetyltransferase-like isoleucine patch superfamily enzyme
MDKSKLARIARGAKRRAQAAAHELFKPVTVAEQPKTVNKTSEKPVKPEYGDGNKVINHPKLLENSDIIFKGKNNILFCEPGVTLIKCKIRFSRDDSVVYLSSGPRGKYISLFVSVSHNAAIFIGKDTNFNEAKDFMTHILANEQKHIIIGGDCIFSLNCWMRTCDAHPIYDNKTKRRLNPSKSILVGDHVWIGHDVTILKGTKVGSGSIIGASSVLSGKKIESNASYAGNPAKAIRSGLFFDRRDANHPKIREDESGTNNTDAWIYSDSSSSAITVEGIDNGLASARTAKAKLTYIKKYLVKNEDKNRFYID